MCSVGSFDIQIKGCFILVAVFDVGAGLPVYFLGAVDVVIFTGRFFFDFVLLL